VWRVQGCAKTETEKAIQKQSREQKTEAGKRTNKLNYPADQTIQQFAM